MLFQTPRIMEGKTDSKTSGEMLMQGAEMSADHVDRVGAVCCSLIVNILS